MYSFCRFRENIIIKLEEDFKWVLMNKQVMEFYVNIEAMYERGKYECYEYVQKIIKYY